MLTYFRHDEGDTGFTTRNPMYDEIDSRLGGLAFDDLYEGEHVRVVTYFWSNGVDEEFPASWAVSRTSCAHWNILFSMKAVAPHFYNGKIMLSLNPRLKSLNRRRRVN